MAAIAKIQGAKDLISSPNGANNEANNTAQGTAIKADTIAPEIILRNAICGAPSLRMASHSAMSGAAKVSPGIPNNAVGIAWVICLATTAAIQKVKTPTGGAPSKIMSNVNGAMVAVSSVPEIKPIAANKTAPNKPKPKAINT